MTTRLLLATAFALVVPDRVMAADASAINRKELQFIEALSAAHTAGDGAQLLRTMAPWLKKAPAARVSIVEAALNDQGLPALGTLLADARLALISQGWAGSMPKVTLREALLLLPGLDEHVDSLLVPPKVEAPLADPAKLSTIAQLEDLLWKLHVQRNRSDSAWRVAEFAAQVREDVNSAGVARLTPDERKIVEQDAGELPSRITAAIVELDEHEMRARWKRLNLAQVVLADRALTDERFFAAYTWGLDAGRLRAYVESIKSGDVPAPREEPLSRPDLAEEIERLESQCRELAGDLTPKAQWLFEGLHWWLRGRYGAGPDVWGLAKSQQALASPAGLFPLFMPQAAPRPTAPGTRYDPGYLPMPYCDRRHHYWWAWEDRGVVSQAKQTVQTAKSYGEWCKSGYFY